MSQEKLNAIDVVNWDYLVSISEYFDPQEVQKNPSVDDGIKTFAYEFTSTADEEIRNRKLTDVLRNATAVSSVESSERVIKVFAYLLRCDETMLLEFAKQCGIKLPRKTSSEAS